MRENTVKNKSQRWIDDVGKIRKCTKYSAKKEKNF